MKKPRAGALDNALSKINLIFCTIIGIVSFYPFYYVIINSFSDPRKITATTFLFPSGFSLETYKQLFLANDILSAFFISTSRTVVNTALSVVLCGIFAYLVTQQAMIGRKFVYRYMIVTMYLSSGLIPWYLVMRAYGLRNTFLLYIIPNLLSAYYIILIKTYIEQIPDSLEESALMDGAGFFKIFFAIIFPLSKPILASIAVFAAVRSWNTWQDNFFLVNDRRLQTIQLILYNYLNQARNIANMLKENPNAVIDDIKMLTERSVQLTITIVSVLPIMLVYPFMQRHFTKGIMLGAVKG